MARLTSLALILWAGVASAQTGTYAYRAATTVDAATMVTIHNNAVAANLLMPNETAWAGTANAEAYLARWDGTRVVVRNGVVVGFWGTYNWSVPGREAIIAPVDVPFVLQSLSAANRLQAARFLVRGMVNFLLASTSAGGVTPTFLSMYWPLRNATGQNAVTALGCQVLSAATENGAAVLNELQCDLVALDAALDGMGIP